MILHARSRMLQGVRVLDLSRVMSGPFCTAMLADLGAEVIKVEAPGAGDEARHFGPYKEGESAYFLLLNRGKKSITVNLKSPEGVALVADLAARSDVVVENFRPGVADRLGVGYAALQARNPRLVYASISGFGADSPMADRPAMDLAIQAMSGLMDMTGMRDGPPTAVGESIADVATGMFAAWGIAAALFERERSGEGRYLEIAMMDSVFSMMLTGLSKWLYMATPPTRVGNRHPETYPVDLFRARDGEIVMVVPNDGAFARFAGAIGRPELAADPRFATYAARNANEPALRDIIAEWAAGQTVEAALATLAAASIPSAPLWSLAEAAESDHATSRGLVVAGSTARLADAPFVPQPVRFGGAEPADAPTAPALGEDTAHVLRDVLGLDDDDMADLSARGAI